ALEGLHNYVAQNPAIITRIFEEITDEWPQRWLLSAAESWAVLHPESVDSAKLTLNSVMKSADLDCRLQAWIVLVRNAQTLGGERPGFPLPVVPKLSIEDVDAVDLSLLEIPPTIQGSVRFGTKFSSIHMLVEYCDLY